MRKIPLKTVMVDLPGQEQPLPFRYVDPIFGVLNAPAMERGLPITEVARSLKVIEAVQAAEKAGLDHALLEEAEYEHLLARVKAFTGWRLVHRCTVEFVEDIENAIIITPASAAAEPEGATRRPRPPARR